MPSTPGPLSRRLFTPLLLAAVALSSSLIHVGCGGPKDAVADEESARRAYLGLDRAIDRAIDLGFDGFSAADSANIPVQMDAGDLSGTMTVDGKVDQGASTNKNMTLGVTLAEDYSDVVLDGEIDVVYNGGPATLTVSFKGLPNATLENSSLKGTFDMTGDLGGRVTLDLAITGMTQADAGGAIIRAPGTIHVVGTATSDYGVFNVDVML